MKRRQSLAVTIVAALLVFMLVPRIVPPSAAQSQSSANSEIETAFNAVLAAEHAGANVTGLDRRLNEALSLTSEGTMIQSTNSTRATQLFGQAEVIATQVVSDAKAEQTTGQAAFTRQQYILVGEVTGLGIAGILVYLYLPGVYWSFWVRLNRDSKVAKS